MIHPSPYVVNMSQIKLLNEIIITYLLTMLACQHKIRVTNSVREGISIHTTLLQVHTCCMYIQTGFYRVAR